MKATRFPTVTEQVAAHLRGELVCGRWSGMMPGRNQLVDELGVSDKTVQLAFLLLEKEGLLVPQGAGRRRRITLPKDGAPAPGFRVGILYHDPPARNQEHIVEMFHQLAGRGLIPLRSEKTLVELGMDVSRIARLVKQTEADAWIVESASKRVLEWFATQSIPTFALFGASDGVPIAGIRLNHDVVLTAFRRLLGLGHRKIVFLAFQGQRRERPGPLWRTMLDEIESHGIPTGPYNMPEWEDSRQGFHRLLDSLFKLTPPTALMIEEATYFIAALQYCGQNGLRVPQDVSLICLEESVDFAYCTPPVAHVRWDYRPIVRRAVSWAGHVARRKKDHRMNLTRAEFIDGGTIGPPPGGTG